MRYLDGVTDGEAAALKTWLLPQLKGAEVAGLRTGFLTEAGAEMIVPSLEGVLRDGGRVYVVTGGDPDQTEPGALAILAGIAAGHSDRATVHLAGPAGSGWQNAKTYYVLGRDGSRAAYIGSANLTRAGLQANQEAGIVLDGSTDGDEAVDAVLAGIRAWADHPGSQLVTPEVLAAFAGQARMSRIGRARKPAAAGPTMSLAQLLSGTLDQAETAAGGEPGGVPTGFADLDALTGGLHPGTLTVIGGRPSLGKSVLLLNFCRFAAVQRSIPVALFTLEMPAAEISMRLLSAEARVPTHVIRAGQMDDNGWSRLAKRMTEIAGAPLYINDSAALSARALCDEATRLVLDKGAGLIAVDCLQLITPDMRSENREREVAEITRQLKALALDLQVPVVITAQLNRDPEYRTDKRPILADLRESDAIAQAADVVILLHREDAYERESPRAGEADLIVAKHRQGPAATVTVAFQGHYQRFVDLAPVQRPDL